MEIYKSVKINIETVMKNLEMLKFVPDHLKTKKKCKHTLKKVPFLKDVFLINIRLKKCVTKQF